jgi:hypothetical protein
MTKVIIYPQQNGSIVVVHPAGAMPVEEVARKDVPAGVPYKIINYTDLPEDQTFFNAWEADFSIPDGFGVGADAWFAEQEAKELEAKNDNNQPE